jgi:hypothetical protein
MPLLPPPILMRISHPIFLPDDISEPTLNAINAASDLYDMVWYQRYGKGNPLVAIAEQYQPPPEAECLREIKYLDQR